MTVADGVLLRASTRFNMAGYGDIMNVWWFRTQFAAAQTDQDVFDGVDALLTSVFADFDHLLENNMTVVDLKLDVVEHIGGKWTVVQNVGYGSWGSGITPGDTGDTLPPGAACLGRLLTGLGKHYGRKYLGLFTENGNTIGFITSAVGTAVLTGLSHLLSGYVISAGNLLISAVPDYLTGDIRDVTEVAVNSAWSYMRSRRQGVGS